MIIKDCIVTDRLILRRFVGGDEEDVLALMSDDYICRMAGIPPLKTVDEARRFMDTWAREAYAITERSDDKVIGIVQTPLCPWDRMAGIGYWLAEDYRGRGYVTEAVEAVKDSLFDWRWCDELRIQVFVGNEASRKVALKCGFHLLYEAYRDSVYSPYGRVESEECFVMTRGEYEWERRGIPFYTTAPLRRAA